MVSKDVDRAIDRFSTASGRIRSGLIVQRDRIQADYDAAPRTFEGEPFEWVTVSDMHENDLDYYIYEMGRLRAMVKSMGRPFGHPTELSDALKNFDAVVPRLKEIRDPRTHPADNDALDRVTTFSAAIKFHDDGSVDYLVDPRYQHHDAAMALLDVVDTYLRERRGLGGHGPLGS